AHGGIEFGTGGDALFVVFESPTGAVAAAMAAQEALAAYAWPGGVTLRARMALHTGEARVIDGDYVGVPLHVVARLCAAGHGGQDATRARGRGVGPPAVRRRRVVRRTGRGDDTRPDRNPDRRGVANQRARERAVGRDVAGAAQVRRAAARRRQLRAPDRG